MKTPAADIILELSSTVPNSEPAIAEQIEQLAEAIGESPPEPIKRTGFYSRACWHMANSRFDAAIVDLENAATDAKSKEYALSDPYFAKFRKAPRLDEKDELWVRFAKAVGSEPASDYLELEPFKHYKTKLEKLGFDRIEKLNEATAFELARTTGAHRATAQSMLDIARLATAADQKGDVLEVKILQVLLAAKVFNLTTLRQKISTANAAEAFYHQLVASAIKLSIVPTRTETIARWIGSASPSQAAGPDSINSRTSPSG